VRNREFAAVLGRVLHRPAFLPVPLAAPALILGREAARALLFDSQRVLPTRPAESGYRFRHPSLEGALRHLLEVPGRGGDVSSPFP
jgi:NAD dependent epimerase/dehydratase family enzyme